MKGLTSPSPEDHRLTEEIARAGWFMHIPLTDHIILGAKRYFSFSDRGLLKNDGWDKSRTCYHRLSEEILQEIKQLLPLADPVTIRRVRRLLRDRGASPSDWKRLKLSQSEEMRIKKEHLLAEFIGRLREVENSEALEALRALIGKDGVAAGSSAAA